jgi:hypothetical protein
MSREEIMKKLGETQLYASAHSQQMTGLIALFSAATMRQERDALISLRDQIHNTIDEQLDCIAKASQLTHELIKLG